MKPVLVLDLAACSDEEIFKLQWDGFDVSEETSRRARSGHGAFAHYTGYQRLHQKRKAIHEAEQR